MSKYDGPAFAYDDHPLLFLEETEAKNKRDELNKDIDLCVYMYSEDVDINPDDTVYVLSIGHYDSDEYVSKDVLFFKNKKDRDDYKTLMKESDEHMYSYDYRFDRV